LRDATSTGHEGITVDATLDDRCGYDGDRRIRPPVRVGILLLIVIAIGVWLRCSELGALGFAEDEIDILRAVSSYRAGDFSSNAEHPMLAKLIAYSAAGIADRWNARAAVSAWPVISEEAALRVPAALAGGIVIPLALFLLCRDWFGDDRIALLAAGFWALDAQAIALNRSAKEDTFFAAFFFLAGALYARAKRLGAARAGGGTASYTASGAAFGLMLASKYMPHYFALHALYVRIAHPAPGHNKPNARLFYAALAAAFFVCDFSLFSSASWHHLVHYFHGQTVAHTGYDFAHRIYVNSVTATPAGVPPRFYVEFLATRMPMLLLGAALVGAVQVFRHPAAKASVFLRIFLVLILLPYSFVGAKFVRYMLPQFALVDVLAALGVVTLIVAAHRVVPAASRPVATLAIAAGFTAVPLTAAVTARPYFALSTNLIGTELAPAGTLAPDDEFNDASVREAVMYVSRAAGPHAAIASDASTVVAIYLARDGRDDLESRSLSRDGLPTPLCETWVIAQDGHRYFENDALLREVAARSPLRVWQVAGLTSVRLYAPESTAPCHAQ
jgi:hypothetical protein